MRWRMRLSKEGLPGRFVLAEGSLYPKPTATMGSGEPADEMDCLLRSIELPYLPACVEVKPNECAATGSQVDHAIRDDRRSSESV